MPRRAISPRPSWPARRKPHQRQNSGSPIFSGSEPRRGHISKAISHSGEIEGAMRSSVRDVRLGSLGVSLERRADGSMLVCSTVPVPPHPSKMTDLLEHWARHSSERVFLAKRKDGADWRRITYGETLASVRRIAA